MVAVAVAKGARECKTVLTCCQPTHISRFGCFSTLQSPRPTLWVDA